MPYFITSSPFLRRPTASASTPTIRSITSVSSFTPGGAVDRVHHVVQIGRELEDVLAIERRDERAIEPVHDLVCDLVGLVLQSLDGLDVGDAALGRRVEQLAQMLRRDRVALGDRDEQIEELFFPGQEAHSRPRVIGWFPRPRT